MLNVIIIYIPRQKSRIWERPFNPQNCCCSSIITDPKVGRLSLNYGAVDATGIVPEPSGWWIHVVAYSHNSSLIMSKIGMKYLNYPTIVITTMPAWSNVAGMQLRDDRQVLKIDISGLSRFIRILETVIDRRVILMFCVRLLFKHGNCMQTFDRQLDVHLS